MTPRPARSRDPRETPGAIPAELRQFAGDAIKAALAADPAALDRALGEYLTEPKAQVWFEARPAGRALRDGVALDRRSQMLHDPNHVFINGESWRVGGRDAVTMRQLADRRRLGRSEIARASAAARSLLQSWCEAGWLHEAPGENHD